MRRISRPIGVFFGERRGRPLPTVPPSSFRIRTSERLLPAATTASLRSADRFFAVVVRRPASGRDGTRQLPPAGSLGISTSSDVLRFSADICVSLLFYQASFTRYGSFLFSLFRFLGGALCVRQPVRQVWRWRRGCYLHHRVCCFLFFLSPRTLALHSKPVFWRLLFSLFLLFDWFCFLWSLSFLPGRAACHRALPWPVPLRFCFSRPADSRARQE